MRLSGLKNRAALDGQPRAAVPHKSHFFYRNLLIRIDAHFAGNLHCLFSDLTRRKLCMLGESLRCGLRTATVHPRAQDLRHSFAVSTLIEWQRSGEVAPRIATLSTYLGHVSPAETYWYLSATPELMAPAAERLHARFGGPR